MVTKNEKLAGAGLGAFLLWLLWPRAAGAAPLPDPWQAFYDALQKFPVWTIGDPLPPEGTGVFTDYSSTVHDAWRAIPIGSEPYPPDADLRWQKYGDFYYLVALA